MTTYIVLSGNSYEVEADTPDEAIQKYYKYDSGETCDCGLQAWGEQDKDDQSDLCECVKEHEVLTEVIESDGSQTMVEEIITALKTWTDEAQGLADRQLRLQALALAWEIVNHESLPTD